MGESAGHADLAKGSNIKTDERGNQRAPLFLCLTAGLGRLLDQPPIGLKQLADQTHRGRAIGEGPVMEKS